MLQFFEIILFFSLTILIFFVIKIIKEQIEIMKLNSYSELLAILNAAKNLAYVKIFRDHIIVNISSKVRLNSTEIEKLSKLYLKIIFDTLGPKILNKIVDIHGDINSISIFLINDFVNRIEDDENKMIDDNLNKNFDLNRSKT